MFRALYAAPIEGWGDLRPLRSGGGAVPQQLWASVYQSVRFDWTRSASPAKNYNLK